MVAAPKLFTAVADGLRITSSHHFYDRARDEPLTLSSGASKRTIPAAHKRAITPATAVFVRKLWRLDPQHQPALVREKSVTGNRRSAADYLLAVQDLQRISRQVARFFVGYDVWLSPHAMSVPLYWNQDNVPIGVQFAGRFGDE